MHAQSKLRVSEDSDGTGRGSWNLCVTAFPGYRGSR